jgi:RNA polymerase sigma-70 factor (ECF subfamily)
MEGAATAEPVREMTGGTIEDDFDAPVAQHRARVFRFALASLRDPEAAQSVTQDCFLRAHKARAQFRGECSVQSWLMQIAVNLIRDAARSRRYRFWRQAESSAVLIEAAGLSLADTGMTPEARLSAAQQVAEIWKLADRLSPNQRTVFLLRFMEDMDPDEIEAATGINKATIKVHLFRAVRSIRERLREKSQ